MTSMIGTAGPGRPRPARSRRRTSARSSPCRSAAGAGGSASPAPVPNSSSAVRTPSARSWPQPLVDRPDVGGQAALAPAPGPAGPARARAAPSTDGDVGDQLRPGQLARRDVHRHRQVPALAQPGGELPGRPGAAPSCRSRRSGRGSSATGITSYGSSVPRRGWRQRSSASTASRAGVDQVEDRLVDQVQLAPDQRVRQVLLERHPAQHGPLERLVVPLDLARARAAWPGAGPGRPGAAPRRCRPRRPGRSGRRCR